MVQPFMPTAAGRLRDMLGVPEERRNCDYCVIDKDDSYGVPMVDLGKGEAGVRFPGLTSAF
ncbi:MAG TPA: hypothetical protein VHV10_17050 [Ktedonobacteraceae bacterium]|nr:hypothetical protein [Ktedonobacteraceae bacterium]